MANPERCRSCQVDLPNGPAQTYTYEFFVDDDGMSTYRVVTLSLCELQGCYDYVVADQAVLDHYRVCPSQDDLRDPECLECEQLNRTKWNAQVARDAAVAKRNARATLAGT